MALDLFSGRNLSAHAVRLVRTLVVVIVEEVLEAVASRIIEQLAGTDRYVLQRGPGGGELARDSVSDVGGILVPFLC